MVLNEYCQILSSHLLPIIGYNFSKGGPISVCKLDIHGWVCVVTMGKIEFIVETFEHLSKHRTFSKSPENSSSGASIMVSTPSQED